MFSGWCRLASAPTQAFSDVSSMPRILLITRNLPPLRGGMERLNLHMVRSLMEWSDLTLIGPSGCRSYLPDGLEIFEVPARPLWRFLLSARRAVVRVYSRHFDLVLAGSGLAAPLARKAAKHSNASSIAYVHGLDLVVSHPLYRLFWLPHLRRLDLALANSRNTANLAAQRGVARGQIQVIHPGVSLPAGSPETGRGFRNRYQLGQRPVLLSVGRLTPRKGLSEFIGHSMVEVRAKYPEAVLVVIGDEAPDALSGSGQGSGASLRKLAAELGIGDALLMTGPCDDATLAQAYFAADVHVFPVREVPGDVEGFGMVAIEAAAHGLPTVAFAVGGVPDAVRTGHSGYLVEPGNYQEFAGRVCEILGSKGKTEWAQTARNFAEGFTWDIFAIRLSAALSADYRKTPK